MNTVIVLLSFAANLDWPLQQLDVKNAFLNGDLKEWKGLPIEKVVVWSQAISEGLVLQIC